MTTVDAALWAVAAMLFAAAVWLTLRDDDRWDPAVFFVAALGALWGGAPPVRGGPVEPDGWDGDLDQLDPAVSPEARLGPKLTWRDVAEDSPALRAEVARRLADTRLVWIGEPPVPVPVAGAFAGDTAAAESVLDAQLERPETRLVLATAGDARPLLQLLKDAPALRDRLRAVLLFAADLDPAWAAAEVSHVAFDTELSRRVPWFVLRRPGQPMLADPPEPPTGRRSLVPIDLGELPDEARADPRVGRALALLVAALS